MCRRQRGHHQRGRVGSNQTLAQYLTTGGYPDTTVRTTEPAAFLHKGSALLCTAAKALAARNAPG